MVDASKICSGPKSELKWCLKEVGFLGRLMGNCEVLKKQYEACMDDEASDYLLLSDRLAFLIKRKENHRLARQSTKKWMDGNKELGLE
ncbi:hypothetical protein BATDEDRAFT_90711 [Batrachochytrium dendrobatidis JAM81]|uniref:COX assembly mitochondrial protein n=1 Tax=Batrachochytrium dendrobatidis (strain JAM81 / FGSC 10211) TaxID=684364 RepID=F4P869_BATDJ|nr:uncharacterized protein BATDEDRAFT_90711 [Batrachochytrium dendrobatidis JAM81]EGF78561.1 hypothetical protein BATDEDRAFT_90711 [Batrachochytrium dendrobatidis JAM81]|eukprot:XP_006680890.1 hypothetical protein BATDEDRAFT_90711 [Batrachochytrium dendrobatidis JAM81]